MRAILVLFTVLFLVVCTSTENLEGQCTPTNSFSISGAVEQMRTFQLEDLNQFEVQKIESIELKRANGEIYQSLQDVKGVLLRDLINSMDIKGQTNTNYSAFLVNCTASDGYQSIYSWNELFNTELGEAVFVIIDATQQNALNLKGAIMMVSMKDQVNGKRNLRCLSKVEIVNFQTMNKHE